MDKPKIIKYLDGIRFKHSIIASAKRIEQNRQHLDDINVFPVPDGDTGTNMAETMRTIADGAEQSHHESFGDMSESIAETEILVIWTFNKDVFAIARSNSQRFNYINNYFY